MYTTPQEIRDILGLDAEDAQDYILEEFIDKAQRVVIRYVQVEVLDEEMSGNINGTNNTFTTSHKFLADTNFDMQITTSDFTVYGWTDSDDPSSKVELTVSTFYPTKGIIVLASAPSTDYKKITINYSYYTCKMDWELLKLATTYYAAMLFVAREYFLVPISYSMGGITVRNNQPWDNLRDEFLRIIYHITSLPMDKVTYTKKILSPRLKGTYKGPGTTLDVLDKKGKDTT